MKIAIVNLTGGGISGGYKKYLINVLPKIAVHSEVETMLCASPLSIDIQDWFGFLPKVNFIMGRLPIFELIWAILTGVIIVGTSRSEEFV